MARALRAFRLLRRGVGFAVTGVRKGVGSAVKLAWPRKRRRKASRKRTSRGATTASSEGSGSIGTWSATVQSKCFPQNLCAYEQLGRKRCQDLATVGCRYWGNWLDGRGLLKVKVYEFAVYMDAEQTRQSALGRVLRTSGTDGLLSPQFYKQLRSSPDIDMSLVLRASRSLPLRLVAGEYEKILRRRLVMVGGESSDPALDNLLSHIDDDNIPSKFKSQKGHIKKGTTLTFKRRKNGDLRTFADDVELGSIKSAKLCAALFDLYIGDKPVCENAKMLAGKRVANFIWEREQQEHNSQKLKGMLVMGAEDSTQEQCSSQGLCLLPRRFDFGGFPQFDFGH